VPGSVTSTSSKCTCWFCATCHWKYPAGEIVFVLSVTLNTCDPLSVKVTVLPWMDSA
jgi:hypothetical protein